MGIHIPQGEWEVLGVFFPFGLNGVFEYFKTEMYSTHESKVDIILVRTVYQQNNYLFFFLQIYFITRSTLAFTRNLLKCDGDFTKKSCLAATLTRGYSATTVLLVACFFCVA